MSAAAAAASDPPLQGYMGELFSLGLTYDHLILSLSSPLS
jgi:hypothetical protein